MSWSSRASLRFENCAQSVLEKTQIPVLLLDCYLYRYGFYALLRMTYAYKVSTVWTKTRKFTTGTFILVSETRVLVPRFLGSFYLYLSCTVRYCTCTGLS
jgi:hypothetical protein